MKEFSSELGQNYTTYTFGYTQYAQAEPGENVSSIYQKGYLPYSGSPDANRVFYRARSARVDLTNFVLTSENRRIAKKFDGQFTKSLTVGSPGDEALEFCLHYFAERHGASTMPLERLQYIFKQVTHTTTYRNGDTVVGYVLSVAGAGFEHYWFSFYDLSYTQQSLGMWLMLDAVLDAKARGLTHHYLGTVYGQKALYKTNFEALEWWDGSEWNKDVAALKERARHDAERVLAVTDLWKSGLKPF